MEARKRQQKMSDQEALRQELAELELEHRDLDDVIARLTERAPYDQLQLQRLKKRKLILKDQIAQVEAELYPDIIELLLYHRLRFCPQPPAPRRRRSTPARMIRSPSHCSGSSAIIRQKLRLSVGGAYCRYALAICLVRFSDRLGSITLVNNSFRLADFCGLRSRLPRL